MSDNEVIGKEIADRLNHRLAVSTVPGKAEEVPPTALPADVYLTKLEALLKENATLRSTIGQIVGECMGTLRGISARSSNYTEVESDFLDACVDPLIAWLGKIKV